MALKRPLGAGLRSLAVAYPNAIRKNDWWRRHHPDVVATAEGRALSRLWAPGKGADAFDLEMAPYANDPFRGTIERRVLSGDETPLTIEKRAALRAIDAAGLGKDDVDLVIVSSFFPNQYYVGNAAFLLRDLEMKCPGWNLETACSSSVVAFQTACALVLAGQYKNVLCVTSCNYSQVADPADTLSWFLGDGAGAFVVSACDDGVGLLGGHTIHTASTCNTFYLEMIVGDDGAPRMRMKNSEASGKILKDTAAPFLRDCCEGAAADAGVALADIDFFVFNTPTAWYAAFCARELGVDPSRTISTFPKVANIGPALMPANLHAAALAGRIRPGQRVLLYSVGSVSTAAAVVVKWGDVGVAPDVDAGYDQE